MFAKQIHNVQKDHGVCIIILLDNDLSEMIEIPTFLFFYSAI